MAKLHMGTEMNFSYIVIQAGGRGSRLGHLTANKPKALVPVDNLPVIFHMFKKYPDKRFVIIGDYKLDVLQSYLEAFSEAKYILRKAEKSGTCGGISDALEYLPDNEPFMLIWCDLILPNDFTVEHFGNDQNYIGISAGLECRWSYKDGAFSEIPSRNHGVVGLFIFKDKNELSAIPDQGEFVKWLQSEQMTFNEIPMNRLKEFGTLDAYNTIEISENKCRPFNQLSFDNDCVIKTPIDSKGRQLAEREINWYKKVSSLGFKKIPEIISYSPLTMHRIDGKNIFELNISEKEKEELLFKILEALNDLHALERAPVDVFSIHDCYYTKTLSRLNPVRNMIPFSDKEHITINGRRCRNIFFVRSAVEDKIRRLLFSTEFTLIHGDCTFSNIMAEQNGERVVFIDPRGYFGFTEIYGDVYYDWAKLYYSVVGNYDQFNRRNFRLSISESEINLDMLTNGWECARHCFSVLNIDEERLKLIHALIWLSLTTYAWEDYDSICGAFYNGLYYLEEVL